jgi:riboflavin biosynthesis pyrimidine reductase
VRQLFPAPADPIDPNDVYGDAPRANGRPGVRLNMIASVDGATSVDGLSGALGGPADHRGFEAMRAATDIVLVAAGTVRAERYGPAELPPDTRDARKHRGQAPVPAIAVVSRTCSLDWQSRFFTAATARPLIVTVADAPSDRRARATEVADVVIAGEKDVDLRRALDAIADRAAESVLAEGGSSLNAQLAGTGLLDELCLTLSPSVVGGERQAHRHGPRTRPEVPAVPEVGLRRRRLPLPPLRLAGVARGERGVGDHQASAANDTALANRSELDGGRHAETSTRLSLWEAGPSRLAAACHTPTMRSSFRRCATGMTRRSRGCSIATTSPCDGSR